MSGLIVIIVFCSAGGTAAAIRAARRKGQRERFTREWIEYIQEDLATPPL